VVIDKMAERTHRLWPTMYIALAYHCMVKKKHSSIAISLELMYVCVKLCIKCQVACFVLLSRMLFVSFFVKNFNDFMHVACFIFFVIYVDNSGEVRGSFDK